MSRSFLRDTVWSTGDEKIDANAVQCVFDCTDSKAGPIAEDRTHFVRDCPAYSEDREPLWQQAHAILGRNYDVTVRTFLGGDTLSCDSQMRIFRILSVFLLKA